MSDDEEKLRAVQQQLSVLIRERDQQRAEIRRLLEEREFVIAQVKRIAQSGTWRWGHRLASLKWRITGRANRDSDAVTRLLQRITVPQLPSGDARPSANGAPRPDAREEGHEPQSEMQAAEAGEA
jgi:hypothetical protein